MNRFEIAFLAIVLANYASYFWSVIGVFRKAEEQKLLDYRALQLVSVTIWVYSVYAVVKGEVSDDAFLAGTAIQALCLAVFWNQSRIVKKNRFSIAFSTDAPQVLVQHGLYKWVRHPFYTVYLCSYSTVAVVTLDWVLGAMVLAMGVVYFRAARFEESKFNGSPLAESYALYKAKTGMFFPKVGKRAGSAGQSSSGGQSAA